MKVLRLRFEVSVSPWLVDELVEHVAAHTADSCVEACEIPELPLLRLEVSKDLEVLVEDGRNLQLAC